MEVDWSRNTPIFLKTEYFENHIASNTSISYWQQGAIPSQSSSPKFILEFTLRYSERALAWFTGSWERSAGYAKDTGLQVPPPTSTHSTLAFLWHKWCPSHLLLHLIFCDSMHLQPFPSAAKNWSLQISHSSSPPHSKKLCWLKCVKKELVKHVDKPVLYCQ